MKISSSQLTKFLLTTSAAGALVLSSAQAQTLTPLTVSGGFNRDIVVATSESGTPPITTTQAFDSTGGGNSSWFELGRNGSDPTSGLPTTPFTSFSNSNITLQFASFTANNALYLFNAASTGTLTLSTPTTMTSLAVFGSSAAGSGNNAVVLNLQGGGTLSLGTASQSGQDWFNDADGIARQVGGRINLGTGVMEDNITNPRIYQDVFSFSAVTVESVSFTYSGDVNSRNAIMALSAEVVPEPSSLLLGLAAAGMMALVRRRSAVRF